MKRSDRRAGRADDAPDRLQGSDWTAQTSAVDGPVAAEVLRKALDGLSERKRLVIAARLSGVSLILLARRFVVSITQIRREEAQAFSRMRHPYLSTPLVAFSEEQPTRFLAEIWQEDHSLSKLIHEYRGQDQPHCKQCGGPVGWPKEDRVRQSEVGYGRLSGCRRLYCSNACRQTAYRARRRTRRITS